MKAQKKGISHQTEKAFAAGGAYAVHDLKCWPEHFQKIKSREKTFDVRHDDRGFHVGDYITLMEYIPEGREVSRGGQNFASSGEYTGEWIRVRVTHYAAWYDMFPVGIKLDKEVVILSFKIEDEGRLSGGKVLQERLI